MQNARLDLGQLVLLTLRQRGVLGTARLDREIGRVRKSTISVGSVVGSQSAAQLPKQRPHIDRCDLRLGDAARRSTESQQRGQPPQIP